MLVTAREFPAANAPSIFKRRGESVESGKCIFGADIQALWHAWNAGEIPDPTDGDEVVQPKSRPKEK